MKNTRTRSTKSTLLLCVGLLCLLTGGAFAGPQLTIPEDSFDFGSVAQHNLITCSFWLKSTGDDTLRILNVIPGCACTEAPLLDSVIAPGDSTRLEIRFNTRQFLGKTLKKPYVMVNADDKQHHVYLQSIVHTDPESLEPLKFEPYRVDVSQFTEKPRRRSRFIIRNVSDQDLHLSLIKSGPLNFDVQLPDKIKAGDEALATVIVKEELIKEPFEQSITIELDDESGTRFTVPIRRDVKKLTNTQWVPPDN